MAGVAAAKEEEVHPKAKEAESMRAMQEPEARAEEQQMEEILQEQTTW